MKKKIDLPTAVFVGALLLGAVLLGFQEGGGILPRGSAAPGFELERLDGTRVSLEALKGKVVVVNFWATWCRYCIAEMPYLTALATEYADRGVVLIAANRDERSIQREAVQRFVGARPVIAPFTVLSAPEVDRADSVQALPANFVVDRQGRVFASREGQVDEDVLRGWIDDALAQKDEGASQGTSAKQ